MEVFFTKMGLNGPDLVRMVTVDANSADWSDGRWEEPNESPFTSIAREWGHTRTQ